MQMLWLNLFLGKKFALFPPALVYNRISDNDLKKYTEIKLELKTPEMSPSSSLFSSNEYSMLPDLFSKYEREIFIHLIFNLLHPMIQK